MLSTMKPSMMVDIAGLETAANFGRLMAVFILAALFLQLLLLHSKTANKTE